MATEKQLEAIKKLASVVKKDYNYDELAQMGNGDLDVIFNELRELLQKQKFTKTETKTEVKTPMNAARFGLACKILCQVGSVDYWLQEPVHFITKVISLYKLFEDAEKSFSASGDSD